MPNDRAKFRGTITHMSPYVTVKMVPPHSVNTGVKKRPNSLGRRNDLVAIMETFTNSTMFTSMCRGGGWWKMAEPNAGFRIACRSPLCRVITACRFMVTAQRPCRFGLSQSGIASELNSAVCNLPQWAKWGVINLLARRCLPLGHPSVASGACAVVQISSSKRKSGK